MCFCTRDALPEHEQEIISLGHGCQETERVREQSKGYHHEMPRERDTSYTKDEMTMASGTAQLYCHNFFHTNEFDLIARRLRCFVLPALQLPARAVQSFDSHSYASLDVLFLAWVRSYWLSTVRKYLAHLPPSRTGVHVTQFVWFNPTVMYFVSYVCLNLAILRERRIPRCSKICLAVWSLNSSGIRTTGVAGSDLFFISPSFHESSPSLSLHHHHTIIPILSESSLRRTSSFRPLSCLSVPV